MCDGRCVRFPVRYHPPVTTGWILIAVMAWIALAFVSRWVVANPRGDVDAGLLWHFVRGYARHMQHLEVRGKSYCPNSARPGPLILVLNHTSGVDPVLAVAACPFEIRWVMASDMRHPSAEGFWQWARVIFVDRKKRDATGTREAMKHVSGGGVLGIFPEGGIEVPAQRIMPFQAGVGLIIRKTGAPVLPIVITGIEHSATVAASFWKRGRAVLEFKPIMQFGQELSAAEIAADLEQKYMEWTGWQAKE